MIEFNATTTDLKKALSVAVLAIGDIPNTIRSHTLFHIEEKKITLYSTDEDKMAVSYFPIELITSDETEFTIDPKRLQTLLTNSGSKEIRFIFDGETKSIKVFASDNKKSFISFPSFEPDKFLKFDLTQQDLNGTINSEMLLKGFKFIQGFLPKDDKNKKYSNLFIENGAMYGSDGDNKIGAFQSSELEGIPEMALRKQMLPPIITMIDKIKEKTTLIKSSDKYITFSSPDGLYCFGFRKSIVQKPKLPISLEVPDADGFNIDRDAIIKKLTRLSLSSWEDFAILATYGEDQIFKMSTKTDRTSYEEISCERLKGGADLEFLMECNRFKSVFSLFQATNVDFYVKERRCILYSKANIVIEEKEKEEITRPFTAIALMTLARKT